jgi:signal recognition particle receptor subunit beta
MAVLDQNDRRLVVRIVFDGPAHAGKTTNLRSLARLFTPVRRGELIAHGERAGRTLYFDWLQFEGGIVAGYPLRCQLLTVPGQAVLAHRRQEVLRTADALVLVCDSEHPEGARRMIEEWRAAPRPLPMILQANKQDRERAADPAALRDRFGLPPEIRIVPAVAEDGVGVKETLLFAMRAAADAVQHAITDFGVAALLGETDTSSQLLARLERLEAGGESMSPTERLLELLTTSPEPAATKRAARGIAPPPAPTPAVVPGRAPAPPTWPLPDRGSVLIWPAIKGRELLDELAGQAAPLEALSSPGSTSGFRFGATLSRLRLATLDSFAELDPARDAMLERARRWTRAAPVLPERVALNLQRSDDGRYWLWEVWPRLPSLEGLIERARGRGDSEFVATGLAAWDEGVATVLTVGRSESWLPDPSPTNFSLAGGRVVVLGAELAPADWLPRLLLERERWQQALAGSGGPPEDDWARTSAVAARLTSDEWRRLGGAATAAQITAPPAPRPVA